MLPYLTNQFGNASSLSHSYGWEASDAVEEAREHIGRLINAKSKEIVITSGATESNNSQSKVWLAITSAMPTKQGTYYRAH